MQKTRYYIFGILILLIGLAILFYSFKYRLPTTSNQITYLEAIIFKYCILIFGLVLFLAGFLLIIFRRNIWMFFRMHSDIPKNILLLAATIILLLVIFEIVFFVVNLNKEEEKIIPDSKLHHVNTPLTDAEFKTKEWVIREKINSIGLRDYEISKKTNKRIIMLGDSFTYGYGVELENTFTKELEKLLEGYDVINTGVVSYSPILEYLYLKNEGLKLEPDIIILNFDMSDVVDDYRYNSSAIFEKNEIVGFNLDNKERKVVNIFMKSNIIKFVKPRFENILQILFEKNIIDENEKTDISNDRYIILRENKDINLAPYWNLTLEYIEKINKLCEDNNIKFVLHVYPYAVQVDGKEWSEGRTKWGFARDKTYTTEPFLILESFAREKNIILINGLEKFKESKEKPLYFSYDGHFNERGHLVVANYIHENLINNNLI